VSPPHPTPAPLRIAILGAGEVGVAWHLPAIREAGGEVVALADSVPGRAAAAAATHGVPVAFDSAAPLIALPEADLIAVCTPPKFHLEAALAVLAAGKHLYLEKPAFMSAAEARTFAAAAARAPACRVLVGSNNLYSPEVQALHALLRSGELGRVFAVESRKTGPGWLPVGWAALREFAGGGVVMTSAAHRIEQTLYLFDAAPVRVSARLHSAWRGRPPARHSPASPPPAAVPAESDVEDTVFALLELADGTTVSFRETLSPTQAMELTYQVFGDKAGASLHPFAVHGLDADGVARSTPRPQPAPARHRHTAAYRHFFTCLAEGRAPDSTPARAIDVFRVVEGIYASAAAAGRTVEL
jgi:predicted dehydrogenase